VIRTKGEKKKKVFKKELIYRERDVPDSKKENDRERRNRRLEIKVLLLWKAERET